MTAIAPYDIETLVYDEEVGEVYNHEWSEDVYLDTWDKPNPRRVSMEYVKRFVERRGYDLVSQGYSDSSKTIINRYEKNVCAECRADAMYDAEHDEYYCPVCNQ